MIAHVHANAIAASTGGNLVGVASRSAASARRFAQEHGVAFHTDDLSALLAHPRLNALCITTPSGTHLQAALSAAEAGKHLLVEKPIEVTPARVAELVSACNRNGVKLAAVFQARFGAGAAKVKEAVEAGRLGRLALCSAYVKWFRDQAYYDEGDWKGTYELDGGGALMNQSIHAIDLLQWLVGMPTRVSAMTGTLTHERIEVEDNAVACLRFPSGALGVIEGSTSTFPGFRRKIELSGDMGTVRLEDDAITCWEFAQAQDGDERIREEYGLSNEVASGASDPRQKVNLGHNRQVQDLIDAILEDRPPRIEGGEGGKAVAIIDAIYESARTGVPVDVPTIYPAPVEGGLA